MFTGASSLPSTETTTPSFERIVGPSLRLAPRQSRVAVLLNANAKRVSSAVRNAFLKVVPREDLFFSRSLEEAMSFARTIIERRYDIVMAGGGDGTVVNAMNMLLAASDAAASGLYRPPLPDIGVLRLGTGNGLAAAVGSGRPLHDTLEVLSGHRPQARPLAMVEDCASQQIHPFASLGYDAQLLNDYTQLSRNAHSPMSRAVMKTVGGYFAALFAKTIPHELSSEKPHIRVSALGRCSMLDPETDEELPLNIHSTLFEGEARCVSWGTTPYYGFKMRVLPFAERRSDRFHVRVSTASIPHILGHLPSIWKGTYRSGMFIDFLVEGIRVESDVALPYQTAGDAQGYRDQLEVRLSPRTFRVLDRLPRSAR